jgi:hypothetical protein
MPIFNLGFFLIGCLGGIVPDILRIIRNKYKADIPEYLKNVNFWLSIVCSVIVGGLTAWISGAGTAKDALIIGYASPSILAQLAAGIIPEQKERGLREIKEAPRRLLDWWRM